MTLMKIAIIGLGNMGKGLARRLAGKADLKIAARDASTAASFAATLPGAKSASVSAAISGADIIVIATPYGAALEIAALPGLQGKIVVDISNPVKPDFSGLLLGHDSSAAEEIQAVAKGAHVVKAFNTIFAGLFDGCRGRAGHDGGLCCRENWGLGCRTSAGTRWYAEHPLWLRTWPWHRDCPYMDDCRRLIGPVFFPKI
jgi:predicted dinucleotide-binding enzyme